jgi:alpha-galactosidase/6-phospho-beta-glucosidase family protein
VNVVNGGRLAGVGPDVVVEVEATIDGSSITIHTAPAAPEPISDLVAAFGASEDLLARAATERDTDLLRAAVVALPHQLRPAAALLDDAVADVMAGEAVGR